MAVNADDYHGVAHAMQNSMEQLEHQEEAARFEQYRLAAEAARRQQAELRERKRLEAEAADLAAELDAAKRAQRELAAEVARLRLVVDGAASSSQRDDQLEAATAALQAKEARCRQELEATSRRADDAEQQAAHFRRASEAQKEALKQAQAEHATALEHARAADLRALKQAQLQLARAAAESENLLAAARDDADARVKQLERELAHARSEAERHRDERGLETAALQAQLRTALDAARGAEERNTSLDEQCDSLRAQLAVLRDVASDARLEANRASTDARALDGSRTREAASRAREAQLSSALRHARAEHATVVEQLRRELLAQAEAHQVALATVKMRTADLRDENRRRTREVKELRREVEGMRASESRLRDVMTTPIVRVERPSDPYTRTVRVPAASVYQRQYTPMGGGYAEARRDSLSGLPTEFAAPAERRETVYVEAEYSAM